MSKKTKASKKRLNSLLMILLLTAVLLVMSTYAWFTANRTVNIDAIDVKVATSSGLQISADGITWKTVLEKTDLQNAYQTYSSVVNQLPSIMAPVSSALTLDTNGRIEMFYGNVETDLDTSSDTYGEYLLTTTKQTEIASNTITDEVLEENEYAKGYFMAFDVFLKVESVADSDGFYMSGSVEDESDKGLDNAARVAVVQSASVADVDDSTANIQGISTANGKITMWEPNADTHTLNGVNNAAALGWATLTAGANNETVKYAGALAAAEDIVLNKATATDSATYFKNVTTKTSKKADTANIEMAQKLSAGITKCRIYLWVEGQDVDCENNASGTDLVYNLSFSLDSYAANT